MSNSIINQSEDNIKHRQQIALFLCKQGFSLLPLRPASKVPYMQLLPVTANGQASWSLYQLRRASEEEVIKWFTFDPSCNYGIITGPSTGLYVLDVDDIKKLPTKQMPPTVIVETGRGYHYYYKSKKQLKTMSFKFGELKGDGGYIVGPGSQHENGKIYNFVDLFGPVEMEIAPLPKWLSDAQKVEARRGSESMLTTERPLNPSSQIKDINLNSKKGVRNNTVTCSIFFEQLEALNTDPETAFKIMSLCGREVDRIGKKFLCPLPGHDERKPSAALWQEPGRPVILNDFHERETKDLITGEVRGGRFSWPLVDVYASCKVGKTLRLRKGERAIWWLRALHEIGAVNPPVLKGYELPEAAKKPARKLYEGFLYLMELRQLYEKQDSAPFSWSFAGQWCGLKSAGQVQQAMKYLLERGYLYMKQPGVKIGEGEGPRSALFSIGRPRI